MRIRTLGWVFLVLYSSNPSFGSPADLTRGAPFPDRRPYPYRWSVVPEQAFLQPLLEENTFPSERWRRAHERAIQMALQPNLNPCRQTLNHRQRECDLHHAQGYAFLIASQNPRCCRSEECTHQFAAELLPLVRENMRGHLPNFFVHLDALSDEEE